MAHRHGDGAAGGNHFHILAQTVRCCQHNAAHTVVANVLAHFHHQALAVQLHLQRLLNGGQFVRERHIHNGAHDLNDFALIHRIASDC